MTRHIIIAFAVALAVCGLALAEGQKLVFFGDARPVVIELQIETGGQPLQEAWNDCVSKIFKHLDSDNDGSLSAVEAARMPQASVLFGGNSRAALERQLARAGMAAAPNMDADKDGKVTKEELKEYLVQNDGSAFRMDFSGQQQSTGRVIIINGAVQNEGGTSADAVNAAVFALFDADKDGKLSKAELAAAPEAIKKLDADDDEMISLAELGIGSGQQGVRFIAVDQAATVARPPLPAPAATGPFAAVTDKASREALGKQLLKRYAPKEGRTVTRKELNLDVETFVKLDADKDDVLDAKELEGVADLPADVVVKVRIDNKDAKEPAVEVVSDKKAAGGVKVSAKDGLVTLELGVSRVEVGLGGPDNNGRIRFPQDIEIMQFKNADGDNNGYLDEKEAMQNPFFRTAFKQMDRDGDGMLFEKEVKEYMAVIKDLQAAAKAGTAVLTVSDQGRGVFDLLDTRRDGKLGLRELRAAGTLLAQLDRDKDEQLDKAEVPKSYQLRANPGGGTGNGSVFAVAAFAPNAPAPQAVVREEGPKWFLKMDRNRDGDVSRREFLGVETEFRKLDADTDGLISREEADKAESKTEK